jgi:hypothetical protein
MVGQGPCALGAARGICEDDFRVVEGQGPCALGAARGCGPQPIEKKAIKP